MFDRYGDVFRWTIPGFLPGVNHAVLFRDPTLVKPLFTAPPEVVDATTANRVLQTLYGESSLFLIDGPQHRRLRKVLLPPLRGSALERWRAFITEAAEAEIAAWPQDTPFALHPRMLDVSLDMILHLVLGSEGDALEAWRQPMHDVLAIFESEEYSLRYVLRRAGAIRLWRSAMRARATADRMVFAEIAGRRRTADVERDDLLGLLLRAEGEPLTDRELRDQVMTMLIAGHETSATTISWAVERLVRHPEALAAAVEEARDGDGSAYAEAVIWETLRIRPAIAFVGRVTRKPYRLGAHLVPENTLIAPYIRGIHTHPDHHDDPLAFRPERFLDNPPGAYDLVPFGGGLHRCLGDRMAMFQSVVLLQTMLRRVDLPAVTSADEIIRRKALVNHPGEGARIRATAA